MTPRFKGKPNFDFSLPSPLCGYKIQPNELMRGRWTGHLFQSRFASVAMDESHLRFAVSYVSLNPVRARPASRAEERRGEENLWARHRTQGLICRGLRHSETLSMAPYRSDPHS
jgi:hypothetical protein